MDAAGVSATTMMTAISWAVKQAIFTSLAFEIKSTGECTDENGDIEDATIKSDNANLDTKRRGSNVETIRYCVSLMMSLGQVEISHL